MIWPAMRSRLGFGIAAVLISVALTLAIWFAAPSRYSATAMIGVPTAPTPSLSTLSFAQTIDPAQLFASGGRLLASDAMLTRIERNLPPRTRSLLVERAGDLLRIGKTRVVDALRDGLSVSPYPDAPLLEVSFESRDPRLSAEMANYIAALFVGDHGERTRRSMETARAALKRAELDAARRVGALVATTPAGEPASGAPALEAPSPELLEQELVRVIVRRTEVEAALNDREDGGVTARPHPIRNSVIAGIQRRLSDLRAERARLSLDYLEGYPPLAGVMTEIEVLERDLQREVDRVGQEDHEQLAALHGQEDLLRREIQAAKLAVLPLSPSQAPVGGAGRAWSADTELLSSLHERLRELDVAMAALPIDLAILEPAVEPFEPEHQMAVATTVGGSILGFVIWALYAFADPRVRTEEEVSFASGLACLPSWRFGGSPQRWERAEAREALRAIRLAVVAALGPVGHVLAVTTTGKGEGGTSLASAIAVALAKRGAVVTLVDADLCSPGVASGFGVENQKGLIQAIRGEAYSLRQTRVPGLSVLPAGGTAPVGSDELESPGFRRLVREIEEQSDYVILDLPAVLASSDVRVVAEHVDGILMVATGGRTRCGPLQRAADLLRTIGPPVIGVVMNHGLRAV